MGDKFEHLGARICPGEICFLLIHHYNHTSTKHFEKDHITCTILEKGKRPASLWWKKEDYLTIRKDCAGKNPLGQRGDTMGVRDLVYIVFYTDEEIEDHAIRERERMRIAQKKVVS